MGGGCIVGRQEVSESDVEVYGESRSDLTACPWDRKPLGGKPVLDFTTQ